MLQSRRALGRNGPQRLAPGDAAYAEVRKLDPQLLGNVSCELIAEVPVRLSTRVRRLTANNPGMMTGRHEYYLIGDAATGIAVIDPVRC